MCFFPGVLFYERSKELAEESQKWPYDATGQVKGGPIRDEPIDISKVSDPKQMNLAMHGSNWNPVFHMSGLALFSTLHVHVVSGYVLLYHPFTSFYSPLGVLFVKKNCPWFQHASAIARQWGTLWTDGSTAGSGSANRGRWFLFRRGTATRLFLRGASFLFQKHGNMMKHEKLWFSDGDFWDHLSLFCWTLLTPKVSHG